MVNGQLSMANRQIVNGMVFNYDSAQFTIHHSPFTLFTIHQSGASIRQETQLIEIDSQLAYCEIHKILCK